MYKTEAPITQTFDTISLEIEKGLTKDDVEVEPISNTKIFVGWAIGNNKNKNKYTFKTKINSLAFKKGDLWLQKRRKLLLYKQIDKRCLEKFALSKHINDTELLESLKFKPNKTSTKKLEKLSKTFEEIVLPLIVHHDVVKKHIDIEGNLDTNSLCAWSGPKFEWSKPWNETHLLFLLKNFGDSLHLVINWAEPSNSSATIVFNVNDCFPYRISSLSDSIKAGDV